MSEPAKPFACAIVDCGMTFTNEDHLHVHTKKHDMYLQLGLEQKAAFAADQTPTPTRFIRNCEEVGLFQDLQNVAANPFDEGFKRAMETKAGILSLETINQSSDDVLHTPQMVFPLLDSAEPTVFNSQRNITISRSPSDESGTIKEFETRTVSKITNEVSISRVVPDDVTIKHTVVQKDVETVSHKNNFVIVGSNIVKKDGYIKVPVMVYADSGIKGITKANVIDISDNNKLAAEKLPIMSQKSIDYVVDSLTSELTNVAHNVEVDSRKNKNVDVDFDVGKAATAGSKVVKTKRNMNVSIAPKRNKLPKIVPKKVFVMNNKVLNANKTNDYEVLIKLPDGTRVRMKPVEEPDPKEIIKKRITNKITQPNINYTKPNILAKNTTKTDNMKKSVPNVVNIGSGTLIPVTLVNKKGTPLSNNDLNKVPITKIKKVTDIANMIIPPDNKVTKKNTKNDQCTITKNTLPMDSPKLFMKVNEQYQGNDRNPHGENSPETNKVVCLTEEDISNKLQENKERLDNNLDEEDDCVVIEDAADETHNPESGKRQRIELERRSAASKRYRERLKFAMRTQSEENRQLRDANQRLIAEKAVLKLLITEHMKHCANAGDMANRLSLLPNGGNF